MTFFVNPFPQSFDANGDPTAQFFAFFGEPNQDPKLFPKAPFSAASLDPAFALPTTIELDNRGSFGIDIFLDGEYSYRIEDTLGGLYRSSPSIIGIPTAILTTAGQAGDNFIVSHETLVCSDSSVSTVDIDATAVVLKDINNFATRIENINLTIDITASGENGLDAGSEASSTFYHYFVIFNPTTVTTAGLFSLSPTAPALPLGFTFFGLVGAIFNDGSSDFRTILQIGGITSTISLTILSNGNSIVTSPTAQIDLSTVVPIVAKTATLLLDVDRDVFDAGSTGRIFSTNSDTFKIAEIINPGGATNNISMRYTVSVPLHEAQTIYYAVLAANMNLTVVVIGWGY